MDETRQYTDTVVERTGARAIRGRLALLGEGYRRVSDRTHLTVRVYAAEQRQPVYHGRYIVCAEHDVPDTVRWDVPRVHQGQIVEVAYADYPRQADEADWGAHYRRTTDRSDRSVVYARYEPDPEVWPVTWEPGYVVARTYHDTEGADHHETARCVGAAAVLEWLQAVDPVTGESSLLTAEREAWDRACEADPDGLGRIQYEEV